VIFFCFLFFAEQKRKNGEQKIRKKKKEKQTWRRWCWRCRFPTLMWTKSSKLEMESLYGVLRCRF